MMKRTKTGLLVVFMSLVIGAAAPAFADDFSPPPWRGGDGTTFQGWTLTNDSPGPLPPDMGTPNPYGLPELRVVNGSWTDQGKGIWQLGEIDMHIPNNPDPQGHKEIWIQLTWMPASLDPFLPEQPIVGIATYPRYNSMGMSQEDVPGGTDGWTRTLFKINLTPNPIEEWITVKGDILVDQVVVDTKCVPEPGTIVLFGLGVIATVRRGIRR